jgi:23S rRNA pseudouridine955/2504/2580 synthase
MKQVVIDKNTNGQKLVRFMLKSYPNVKMNNIYKWIRDKRIKINGKKTTDNYVLNENDLLELYINDEFLDRSDKVNLPANVSADIDVVYEDENIMLINKPVGLVSQDDEDSIDTVNNRLLKYLLDEKE